MKKFSTSQVSLLMFRPLYCLYTLSVFYSTFSLYACMPQKDMNAKNGTGHRGKTQNNYFDENENSILDNFSKMVKNL